MSNTSDEERLAQLERQIQAGVTSTTTDGTTTTVDLKAMQEEANRLRRNIATESRRRPKVGSLRIF